MSRVKWKMIFSTPFWRQYKVAACATLLGTTTAAAASYVIFMEHKNELSLHVHKLLQAGSSSVVLAAEVFQGSVNKWDTNWDRRDPSFSLHTSNSKEKKHKLQSQQQQQQMSSSAGLAAAGDTQAKEDNNMSAVPPVKTKPTATRHLILIRHGQYNMVPSTDDGRTLTDLGKEQARLTGDRLTALAYPYTILYSSSMSRAAQTADIIEACLNKSSSPPEQATAAVPRKVCDLIREGAPIPPEPPVGHWRPEAQQFYEDGARIEAGFRKYFHRADLDQERDSYEIIVCHANVIRYYVCRALQFPPEAWLRMSLPHGSITWLTIRPTGRVVLRSLGDSGHIPPDKLSSA